MQCKQDDSFDVGEGRQYWSTTRITGNAPGWYLKEECCDSQMCTSAVLRQMAGRTIESIMLSLDRTGFKIGQSKT